MDDEQRTPSREEQAKARRRKILDRLNSIDSGVSRYDREQEERRARGIDIASAKERRPEPGNFFGDLADKARQLLGHLGEQETSKNSPSTRLSE